MPSDDEGASDLDDFIAAEDDEEADESEHNSKHSKKHHHKKHHKKHSESEKSSEEEDDDDEDEQEDNHKHKKKHKKHKKARSRSPTAIYADWDRNARADMSLVPAHLAQLVGDLDDDESADPKSVEKARLKALASLPAPPSRKEAFLRW